MALAGKEATDAVRISRILYAALHGASSITVVRSNPHVEFTAAQQSIKGVFIMKKDYLKPDVEYVSLVAREEVTSDDYLDGEVGIESSDF